MNDKQDKPDLQASVRPEAVEEKIPKLREISEEELNQILEKHEKWYEQLFEKDEFEEHEKWYEKIFKKDEYEVREIPNVIKDILSRKVKHDEPDLSWANLGEADLSGANLIYANLSGSNLNFANLSGANLQCTKLIEAKLSMANLSRVDLSRAKLKSADLSMANLSKANLSQADLSGVDLSRAKLKSANLSMADLHGVDLSMADLRRVDLRGAKLYGANLNYAKLSGANLGRADLHGAIVDEHTLRITKKVKNGQVGVNGIWAEYSDSAALMSITPPGNSMQGSNPEAVIESLKRARRLHGYSLVLVGIVLLIWILNLSEIQFPWTKDVKITPDRFVLLAMLISIGLLILINSFMSDALRGARYLRDRKAAMLVGNFPWALSRYAGKNKINRILSYITRIFMSYHQIVFVYFLNKWQVFTFLGLQEIYNISIFMILSVLALILSGWTFNISERFQKPIIFDRKTEEEQQDDMAKLSNAVESQTKTIVELIHTIKPQEANNLPDPKKYNSQKD